MPIFPRFADGATPAAPGEDAPLLISAYDAFSRRDAYGLAEDWTPLLPMTVGERLSAVDAKMNVYVVDAANESIPDALHFWEFVAEHRTYADERLFMMLHESVDGSYQPF